MINCRNKFVLPLGLFVVLSNRFCRLNLKDPHLTGHNRADMYIQVWQGCMKVALALGRIL